MMVLVGVGKNGNWGPHLLLWKMLVFFDRQHTATSAAYSAKIQPRHNKCYTHDLQTFSERQRTFFPESESVTDGLVSYTPHGCVVAGLVYIQWSGITGLESIVCALIIIVILNFVRDCLVP
jgi:hypothetical protein